MVGQDGARLLPSLIPVVMGQARLPRVEAVLIRLSESLLLFPGPIGEVALKNQST